MCSVRFEGGGGGWGKVSAAAVLFVGRVRNHSLSTLNAPVSCVQSTHMKGELAKGHSPHQRQQRQTVGQQDDHSESDKE